MNFLKLLGEIKEELRTLQKNNKEVLEEFQGDFEKFPKKKILNEIKDFWELFGKFLVLANTTEIFGNYPDL